VVGSTTWAHIHNLTRKKVRQICRMGNGEKENTIAVMEFPSGPVTEIQAPHSPASSQFESDNAVPSIEDGRV
jgi:hypothetical protein